MTHLRDVRAAWAGGQRVGGMWLGGGKVWSAPAGPVPLAPLRAASAPDAMTIHSGHSLTDTLFQAGTALHGVRQAAFGPMPVEATAKSTIPGSSTRVRWEAPAGSISEVHARYDIANYELMTVTERGLDVVGVAPHYVMDDPIAAQQINEDLTYLWYFVDNARRNGNGGQGAESILWAIWPAIDGSMGDFRSMLDVYETRWHYRQDVMNHWLADAGETRWPYMHVIPGHRLMARLCDDIQAGIAPGLTAMQDLFDDNIHPNAVGVYAIQCLVFSAIWRQSPVGLPFTGDPAITPEQQHYFQSVAWEIAQSYARAGLGGTDLGAPGVVPAPDDVDAASVPGFAWQSGEIVSDGTAPLAPIDTPPIGPALYGVMAVTFNEQSQDAATVLRFTDGQWEQIAMLNYRSDLDRLLLETTASGGNHISHGPVAVGEPVVIEFWISNGGSMLRGAGPQASPSTSLAEGSTPAVQLNIGSDPWGPAPFNGVIHNAAFFNGVPTDEERLALRAWAHEQAGLPFTERAIPERPAT